MIVIIFIVEHLVVNHIGDFQNSTVDWNPMRRQGFLLRFLEWKVGLYFHAFGKDSVLLAYIKD